MLMYKQYYEGRFPENQKKTNGRNAKFKGL